MNWRLLAITVATLPALSALGGDLEDGIKYHETKAYSRAIPAFERAARSASAEAERRLGMMHYRGEGRAQDNRKAISHLERAVEGGDSEAAILLGKMYEYGLGTVIDQSLAALWYTKGAEIGRADSQFEASIVYYKGWGVARDPAEAVKWWTLAMNGPAWYVEIIRPSVESAQEKLTAAEIAEGRERARQWAASHR